MNKTSTIQGIFSEAFNASSEEKNKITEAEAGELLDVLDERERKIIHDRFLTEEKLTLEQVGRKFGVTRERIRQLQNIAMMKLRRALERLRQQKSGPTPQEQPASRMDVNDLTLDTVSLPTRAATLLHNAGINTVGQLRSKTAYELLGIRGFGKKSLRQCGEALSKELKIEVEWRT
jgi:DNA-directed RNA polymerase alpha subunit